MFARTSHSSIEPKLTGTHEQASLGLRPWGRFSRRLSCNSNLLSFTDAKNNQTTYSYDELNHRISRTDALIKSESYVYDGNDNLTQYTDRRGTVDTFTYDGLNRRTFAGFGKNGSQYQDTTSYTWDGGDRVTQAVDSIAGTIGRVYDGLDRLTSETTPQGTVGYTYDNVGRRLTMTVPGQSTVNYCWDNANRLNGVSQQPCPNNPTIGFQYDNANRRTTLTLPNGVTVAYSYDNDSRVKGLTYTAGSTQLGNLTYSYDGDGRRITTGGSLAAVTFPAAVSGNTFNPDNGMTGFNGSTLGYDANGNLTDDGTNNYTWDARNHLSAISGGATASFVYDALGRRISKTIGGTTTQFLYDRLNPVQELNSSNGVTANLLTGLNIDEYFTRTASGATSTLLTDALGSTIGLVSASNGPMASSYTYQSFGGTTAGGAANTNPYQFTGRENDGTGLYSYRARYYSPLFQRFVTQDPIGFGGGDTNLYSYAGNDPISETDPQGLIGYDSVSEVGVGIALGAAIAGVQAAHNGASASEIVEATVLGGASGAAIGWKISKLVPNLIAGGLIGGVSTVGQNWLLHQPLTCDLGKGILGGMAGAAMGSVGDAAAADPIAKALISSVVGAGVAATPLSSEPSGPTQPEFRIYNTP
jgi:RHS repeat-associated protein